MIIIKGACGRNFSTKIEYHMRLLIGHTCRLATVSKMHQIRFASLPCCNIKRGESSWKDRSMLLFMCCVILFDFQDMWWWWQKDKLMTMKTASNHADNLPYLITSSLQFYFSG